MWFSKPTGMLLLAGVAFLALSASSASARTGVATSAEPVNGVVQSDPVAEPAGVGVPIDPLPWPVPGPGTSWSGIDPIMFQEPIGLPGGQGQPIDPDPGPASGGSLEATPLPIEPFELA